MYYKHQHTHHKNSIIFEVTLKQLFIPFFKSSITNNYFTVKFVPVWNMLHTNAASTNITKAFTNRVKELDLSELCQFRFKELHVDGNLGVQVHVYNNVYANLGYKRLWPMAACCLPVFTTNKFIFIILLLLLSTNLTKVSLAISYFPFLIHNPHCSPNTQCGTSFLVEYNLLSNGHTIYQY